MNRRGVETQRESLINPKFNGSASYFYKSPCPKLLKSPSEVLGIPILKDLPCFIITLFQKFSASPRQYFESGTRSSFAPTMSPHPASGTELIRCQTFGNIISNQKGASIVAVVAAMLILGVMGVTLISLVTTGSDVSINQLQSEKAFNIAAGGMEYTLAKNKSNIPNYSTKGAWVNLGDGDFKVDTSAYLDGGIDDVTTTITVDSTAAFPSAGSIVIDSELITYTGTNGTQFTGATRGASGTIASVHADGNSVYPAARLAVKIPSDPSCAAVPTITLSDNTGGSIDVGFYISSPYSHSFFIDNEYFYCTGKSLVPPYTFTGCTRCYAGSPFGLHSSTYAAQYVLTSTGRITNIISNNAQRIVRVSAGPKEE